MVSRKVFWGASNPFITGIFPARCKVPHQSLPTRVVREESAEGARGKGRRRQREGEKDGNWGGEEEDGDAAAPPPAPGVPRSELPARRHPLLAAGRGDCTAPRTGAEHHPGARCPRAAAPGPIPSPPEGKSSLSPLASGALPQEQPRHWQTSSSSCQPESQRFLTLECSRCPKLETNSPRFVSNITG